MSDIEDSNFEKILECIPVDIQKDEKEYENKFPYLRDNYNDETQFNKENENSFHAQSELFEYEEDEPEENFYNEEIEVIHEENIRYYDLYEDIQRHPLDEDYYN